MGEQLEARKDEALTAVEEAIYGALKRADLLREVGPFLRQILALEALGAVLSVVRAESGQPSSVPSSPHETGQKLPTSEESSAAAAVPVGDVVVERTAAERQRIMDGSATVTDVDRLYRQVGRKLRAALNGEGTE